MHNLIKDYSKVLLFVGLSSLVFGNLMHIEMHHFLPLVICFSSLGIIGISFAKLLVERNDSYDVDMSIEELTEDNSTEDAK